MMDRTPTKNVCNDIADMNYYGNHFVNKVLFFVSYSVIILTLTSKARFLFGSS